MTKSNKDNKTNRVVLTNTLRDKILELARTKGYISIISGLIGVPRSKLLDWINEDESLAIAFARSRAELLDELREKMIEASHNKRTDDWRQYYQQLQTLEKEFSANKWLSDKNDSPSQTININISSKDVESASAISEKIIRTIPHDDKRLQRSKVRLLTSNEEKE